MMTMMPAPKHDVRSATDATSAPNPTDCKCKFQSAHGTGCRRAGELYGLMGWNRPSGHGRLPCRVRWNATRHTLARVHPTRDKSPAVFKLLFPMSVNLLHKHRNSVTTAENEFNRRRYRCREGLTVHAHGQQPVRLPAACAHCRLASAGLLAEAPPDATSD